MNMLTGEDVRTAGLRQLLPPPLLRIGRQAPPQGAVGRRRQLPGRDPLLRCRLQRLELRLVVCRPRCSIWRDPRREDRTIWTAVAPDVVLTVRMYGTRPLYGPRLVRKFSFNEPKTCRSETRDTGHGQIVAQVRFAA